MCYNDDGDWALVKGGEILIKKIWVDAFELENWKTSNICKTICILK